MIDCNDLDRMFAFWREALGYVPRYEPEHDWASLRDPADPNVNVSLQVVPEPRVGKNRLHLDLYTDDQAGEVERLLGLGATSTRGRPTPTRIHRAGRPEGNLFCVIQGHETLTRTLLPEAPSRYLVDRRRRKGVHRRGARGSESPDELERATSPRASRGRSRCRRPASTGEPFARAVAASSEPAVRIV